MTTPIITSSSGFEPHTTPYSGSPTGATGPQIAKVYEFAIPIAEPAQIPDGFTRIGDYVSQLEERHGSSEIRAARARLAALLRRDQPMTLRAIRLALGLSQAELAAKVGTSQSQIARIETGSQDPTYDTFARLAHALGVEIADVVAAFGVARNEGQRL